MQVKKILFHTRFREFSFNALETLMDLKQTGLNEVILVYIIDREEVSFVPYGGYLKKEENRIRESAESHFDKWQAFLSKQGVKSRALIETGIPNVTLLKIAHEKSVDLIVTGRKKRTLLEKVYVGSHILDLLRRSPIPILMHKYQVEYKKSEKIYTRVNKNIFKQPMVATDWSVPSEHALLAVEAFKAAVEKVYVTHVVDTKLIKYRNEREIDLLKQESKHRLSDYCHRLEQMGIKGEPLLVTGKTVPEIIKLSQQYDAGMIIMGRTGKDWFEEYWLGGVSHRIAEISELPVLLVP